MIAPAVRRGNVTVLAKLENKALLSLHLAHMG